MTTTFIELCVQGDVAPEQIDDFVEDWHAAKAGKDTTLPRFLGMDEEEYNLWTREPDALYGIVQAHQATRIPGEHVAQEPAFCDLDQDGTKINPQS